MSSEKFTKGPWRYCGKDREQCKCVQVWSVPADFNVVICLMETEEGEITEEEYKANSRLVAAAPEMYELLKTISEVAPDHLKEQINSLLTTINQ